MYGEWLFAKHTIFYDALPAWFLEFDVLDTVTGAFLDTPSRRELLAGTPVHSVPVLHAGAVDAPDLPGLVGRSRFTTPAWRERLTSSAGARGLDPDAALAGTDPAGLMEGLYLKEETGGQVVARFKWVRRSFLDSVAASGSHWLDRPIIPNLLAGGGPR
jgi:hypothetical protein